MYSFRNLSKQGSQSAAALPSEAMTFDGRVFENEIEGYQTLSVSGRNSLNNGIQTQSVDGRDGVEYVTANASAREITVKYLLKALTPEELNIKCNTLKYLLRKKQARLSFADETDCEYTGTLQSMSDLEDGLLNSIGNFTILCSDPYKHKAERSFNGVGSAAINCELWYEVLPERIIVTPVASTGTITIKNVTQGKAIELQDAFTANTPIYLYPQEQDIVRNNVSQPGMLTWTSDFEDFAVNQGDTITVTPSTAKMEIFIRERLL